jgi:nicotinamidase-related amidase
MKAFIVIDAQNEFSEKGKRPVPDFAAVIEVIKNKIQQARREGHFIAWIRHFNKAHESPAFLPNTWGSEFAGGLGLRDSSVKEWEFHKDVYGAFTGTSIGAWIRENGIDEVELMGFYSHGCVSTTAREAIMEGLTVVLDHKATATCPLQHELLGSQGADEVRRSVLLQLANMGAVIK